MRTATVLTALALSGLWLAGCAATPRNQRIAEADFREDYGYRQSDRTAQVLHETFIVATFSGGGTRAAALAQGALNQFAAILVAGEADRRLADEIDLISSVSGGSVTAANFALNGRRSFADYEIGFLKRDMMTPLIASIFNPLNWPRFWFTSDSRIDVLIELLDERVFARQTFADLLQRPDRPYLILNAADMSSGARFQFTQSSFDLLCSDLNQLSVAQAVAASAAFPAGLTPIMLTNHSPCPVQDTADGRFLISHVEDSVASPGQPASDAVYIDSQNNLPRRSQGLREARLLNANQRKDYVHLLDGGIADNLGLAEPLALVTGATGRDGAPPTGIDRYVFIVVNARSDATTDVDQSPATPGIPSMALSSINAAIDGRTTGLQAQLSVLPAILKEGGSDRAPSVDVVSVDFDLILEPVCRQEFANIGTNWSLEPRVVDSLLEMGGAMVLASPQFRDLARQAGANVDDATAAALAQLRARQACTRLLDPTASLPPVAYTLTVA